MNLFSNGGTISGLCGNSPLQGNTSINYTFNESTNLFAFGMYELVTTVYLDSDADESNNILSSNVTNANCTPLGDLSYGDGFQLFQVGGINNNTGEGGSGYEDFTNLSTDLEQGASHELTVTTGYGNQYVRVWIDFNDDYIFTLDELCLLYTSPSPRD